ncbi:MAG: alpha/beta hydrolase [Rhodospirillales bacterium]|nr:alpha/beta hydrolase [Rhodospirillales bacterium]
MRTCLHAALRDAACGQLSPDRGRPAGFGASPPRDDVRTIAQHAKVVAALADAVSSTDPVGLVGHSVGSMIAVEAASQLAQRFGGLFSIEGNLTAEDAYFSGRAADFDDPHAFKRRLLDDLWTMAQTQPILRRFHGTMTLADPVTMWTLGCDARRLSIGDAPGQAYLSLRPSLYYWSPHSTAESTRKWIARSGMANLQFTEASHWPTIDQPAATRAPFSRSSSTIGVEFARDGPLSGVNQAHPD